MGYVGLPLALLFTEAGFPVTGFDIDPEKVTALKNGRSYIFRIPETRSSARQGLPRDGRLFPCLGDGRHHHLRSHAAE